jgi:hypothetical protein
MSPNLPTPRGPLTSALIGHLTDGEPLGEPDLLGVDPLVDDDLHLALWCCYELHYHGFDGVPDGAEWDPAVLAFRTVLEAAFEAALRDEHRADSLPADPSLALRVIATWAGPPLAATLAERGTLEHLAEFAVHRSIYQLKEADPHTWAIPRLAGRARTALLEIQVDEYGRGRPGEAHAELFASAMAELGLVPEFAAYIDRVPGETLATDNLVSMFGLQRRLRGALVGHLALFEVTSVRPMARYLAAARRLGGLPATARFYEAHVDADAHHGELALRDLVVELVADQPELAPEVVFGAAALARVEARFARRVLRCWDRGESSLRPGLEDALGLGAPARPGPVTQPMS